MKKKNSIRDILKFQNETATPLGILLYAAAKKIVAILWHSPNKGVVKIKEGISPLDVNQIIFSASVCFSLVMVSENERDKFIESTISDMDTLYDMSVDFLRQFPTQELARENFSRPVVFSDNSVMSHALDVTEQIKNLTIDEAHDLILAQPLVRNFKDNFAAGQMIESPKATSPKIEDPTDQRIWEWIKEDPSITDNNIAQRLGISRQAVNPRRRSLEKMGYPVRKVSRQK